jgi:hypothetical protein
MFPPALSDTRLVILELVAFAAFEVLAWRLGRRPRRGRSN